MKTDGKLRRDVMAEPASDPPVLAARRVPQDIRAIVIDTIRSVAPETDVGRIPPDRPLRQVVELDSMDWLNVLAGLKERLSLEIPPSDHARLSTLDGIVDYVASRQAGGSASAGPAAPRPPALPRTQHLIRGTPVLIRPMRDEDMALEAEFVRHLSRLTRYRRFMVTLNGLPPDKLANLTHVDQEHHVALVAETLGESESALAGVVRYVVDASGTGCEFAVTIDDAWQGTGLAGILMHTLMTVARSRGLATMEGLVLRANGGPRGGRAGRGPPAARAPGRGSRVGVVLLAATNRPEILDPALLRAGRFDRQVLVDRPDRLGRAAILQVHARKIRLAPQTDLDQVAAITVGFAGADLANLVNEAALIATQRRAEAVTLADFTQAIERIVAGIEKKNRLLGQHERRLIAYHELGHALTALALPGSDRVHKVSIGPRGVGALGYTLQRPSEDRRVLRRSELFDRLTVLLGGRAAERLVFGEPSTGAADDLGRATDLARDMVLRYGMDDGLGPVSYAEAPPRLLLDETRATAAERTGPATAERIDRAVHDLLLEALDRAGRVLEAHRAALDRCASALVERETLDEGELLALAGPMRPPVEPAPPMARAA